MAILSKTIENGVLTIIVEGFAPIMIDPADYPSELVDHAALHGFAHKYGDAGALSAGATNAEKHAAIMLVVQHHQDTGEWNRKGGGDGSGTGDGLLVAALVEWTNGPECPDGQPALDRASARAVVGAMPKPTQRAMRGAEPLASIIARIKTARAPKTPMGFDAASVLAGLTRSA